MEAQRNYCSNVQIHNNLVSQLPEEKHNKCSVIFFSAIKNKYSEDKWQRQKDEWLTQEQFLLQKRGGPF